MYIIYKHIFSCCLLLLRTFSHHIKQQIIFPSFLSIRQQIERIIDGKWLQYTLRSPAACCSGDTHRSLYAAI